VPLATFDTHGPMPWVPAAEAEAEQLLTAWVTTEPWLVLEPELEVSLDVSLEVSVEVSVPVVVSVETTVWC